MKHQMITKTCEQCGGEFVAVPKARFCPACKHKRQRAASKRWNASRTASKIRSSKKDNAVARDVKLALHEVTNENLQDWYNHHRHDPNNRPQWCSPVRWRIFLRFMKNAAFYAHMGELHPGQARGICTVKINPIRNFYS